MLQPTLENVSCTVRRHMCAEMLRLFWICEILFINTDIIISITISLEYWLRKKKYASIEDLFDRRFNELSISMYCAVYSTHLEMFHPYHKISLNFLNVIKWTVRQLESKSVRLVGGRLLERMDAVFPFTTPQFVLLKTLHFETTPVCHR